MKEFNKKLQTQFNKMTATGKLFRSSLTGQQVWDLYIKSFDNDPIYRDPASSEHNCNLCNNFIRRYGNVVAITDEFKTVSIFDFEIEGEYAPVVAALAKALHAAPIAEVFFETFDELNKLPYEKTSKSNTVFQLGMSHNTKRYTKEEAEKFGRVKENDVVKFDHMHLFLSAVFVDMSGNSVESLMGTFRDAKNVFQRAMETISLDTLFLVRDLINQGSLLDGQTHLYKIEEIIPLKETYDLLHESEKNNWLWVNSYKFKLAKFRGELIGALCVELSEGKELNEACKAWNIRVDPVNYMKTSAPITAKQIAEAKTFVEENGYVESFNRRFATIDDIKVSEILHSNVGDGKVKSVSIFDGVKSSATRHKRNEFDGVEEVSIEKFMKDILPGCSSVEAFLKNSHSGNMVSLTTANAPDSKPIFKWDNNYSWTFNGNLAGKSEIKQAVKSRGGQVEGVMRISLAFPNTADDYDLHLTEPNGGQIYYSNLRNIHNSSGVLDLDAQGRDGHQLPEKRVENIIYTDKSKMPKGIYTALVNNYSNRGLRTPFAIEIEIDGEITLLNLKPKCVLNKVPVATVSFNGVDFEIKPSEYMEVTDSKSVSKEIYGLDTNQFHKVNLICLTPNHWEINSVGNKHYLFMLEDCKSPESIRSFHNENLIPELLAHRKVMEVLGAKNMIAPTDKQLSGLGFNATIKDELVVKLTGTHNRTIKIKF